jgi:hypothetical protein
MRGEITARSNNDSDPQATTSPSQSEDYAHANAARAHAASAPTGPSKPAPVLPLPTCPMHHG